MVNLFKDLDEEDNPRKNQAKEDIRSFLKYMKEEAPSKFELTLISIGLPINTEYDTLGECIDRWWDSLEK